MISCHQITKLLCAKYLITSALSAESPCDLGPLAHFAILVFLEASKVAGLTRLYCSREILMKRFTRDACGCFNLRPKLLPLLVNELLQPVQQITQRASQ